MRMRETTVATTIFLRIALCLLALASTTTAQADPTDDYIAAQMRSQNIPGLSLAIIKDGKIVKMQGYGLADVKGKVPATPETVYDIASIGKSLVATGMMLLAEEGLLRIDDPITKHLDGLPHSWGSITFLHLSSNISCALPSSPVNSQYRDCYDSVVIRTAYSLQFRFASGDKWE